MLTLNDGRSELWQWDTGRTLAVDADCSQVHFSNKVFGRSIDVDVVDGAAIIPDILLQTDKELNVWAFVGTAENGYTKISKTFKVNRRNKPADYVFTPVEQTTLAELSVRLDRIEESQDPDAIKNAVEDYLAQNPVEVPVQSVNGQIGAVELTAENVGAISQGDLQTATNEVLAQAKASGEFDGADGQDGAPGQDGITPTIGENGNWYLGDTDTGKPSRGETGPAGADGRDGADGQPGENGTDGYSPTANVTQNDNGAIITITDKNGTTMATVTNGKDGADGNPGADGRPGKDGADGKSAYQYAQEGGYTGTEAEFAAKLAEEMPDKLPNPNALTFTGAASGSYDGSAPVTVNIPEGGGGTGGGYSDYEVLIDETITTDEAGISAIRYTELDFSQYNDIVIFFDRANNNANANKDIKVGIDMLGYSIIHNHSVANPKDSYRSSIFRVLNMGNGNVASFACTANNQHNNPAPLNCCGIFPLNLQYTANRDNGFNLKLSGAYIGTIKLKILAK